MKKLTFFLAIILFYESSFAATGSGNISSVTSMGGVNTTDAINTANSNPDGYFQVFTGRSITAPNVGPLYKNGVAYQVPNGKTFVVNKICASSSQSSVRAQLITASASFINDVAVGTLTSPLYQGGSSGADVITLGSTNVFTCFSAFFSVTQNLYLGFQGDTTTGYNLIVTGKEI